MIQQTEPTPEAMQAAQRIVDIVNLDGAHKLNGKATHDIAAIIEREAIPPAQMTEAPYSWNTTATGPEGFDEQFTVRAITPRGFAARVDLLKAALTEKGYKPHTRSGHSTPTANGDEGTPGNSTGQAPVCAIHNKPMVRVQGNKGAFYSCHEKLQDGSYCPYKPAKAGA